MIIIQTDASDKKMSNHCTAFNHVPASCTSSTTALRLAEIDLAVIACPANVPALKVRGDVESWIANSFLRELNGPVVSCNSFKGIKLEKELLR